MLRTAQGGLRVTQQEIEEFYAIGIDVTDVRSSEDFAVAMEAWLRILCDERPELFDKITQAMAVAKDVQLPR
jgi:hypothetical protein